MPQRKNNTSDSTDLATLIQRYKRLWWLPVLTLALCFAAALFYLKIKPPVYLVQATVLIDEKDDTPTGKTTNMIKSLAFGQGTSVDDEIVVMGSQQLRMQMVKQLRLNRAYKQRLGFLKHKDNYNNSPIEIDAPESLFDTLSVSFVMKIEVDKQGKADITAKRGMFKTLAKVERATLPASVKTPYGIFVVKPTEKFAKGKPYNVTAVVSGNVPKAESLAKTMTVDLLRKKANAIDICIEETDPVRGREMLATLITLYNQRGQEEKDQQALNTAEFIDKRLELVYKDLMGSEAEIESYKRTHNIIDPELQTKSLIGKQDVADRALINLDARYRIVTMIKEYVQDPANKNSLIPFSADSTAASGAISAYNNLMMKRMQLEASALDNNPRMQQIDEQLETLRKGVISGVNNSLRALEVQMAKAGSVSAASGGKMSSFPTTEREVRSLYRQQGIQNEIYTFLLQKREENALLLAANTPKGHIVDLPYVHSEPISPKKELVFFLALVAGLLLPLLIIGAYRLLNNKFSSQQELETLTSIPVIGHIQHNRTADSVVVSEGNTTSNAELFRYIRNNVQFMLPADSHQTVLVTSSVSGEGKTFVSVNLAAAFTLLGKQVALVGLDIRNPQLADALNINKTPGATGFLAKDGTTLDDVIQHSPLVPGLDVIVGGAIPPNPSELLLSKRLEHFMTQLSERYDIVVVDSAPVGMVSDTFSLAKYAQMTIAVARARHTTRAQVDTLNRIVDERRLSNVGIVLNDTRSSHDNEYGYSNDTAS